MNYLRDLLAGALVLSFTAITFAQSAATPAETLKVLPGFKVELLKSAGAREGSWVSMAIDTKGRLYISPQGKAPDGDLLRLTLDAAGRVAKTEWINLKVGAAMGMLWAFDSLYVSGEGPDGQGIYRLRDTNGDDQLDEVRLFKKVPGGNGEHGAHALVLGPDGKSIYIAHGNATPPAGRGKCEQFVWRSCSGGRWRWRSGAERPEPCWVRRVEWHNWGSDGL